MEIVVEFDEGSQEEKKTIAEKVTRECASMTTNYFVSAK